MSKKPLELKGNQIFQYKYVLMNEGKLERWEKGTNRIVDMRLLADESLNGPGSNTKSALYSKGKDGLTLELDDLWEKFRIQVSVAVPAAEPIHTLSCQGSDGLRFEMQ